MVPCSPKPLGDPQKSTNILLPKEKVESVYRSYLYAKSKYVGEVPRKNQVHEECHFALLSGLLGTANALCEALKRFLQVVVT